MRTMRRALFFMVLAALLALPGTAGAVVLTPPGHSGTDQYYETIPTSSGNAAPPQGAPTGGSPRALAGLGRGPAGAARLSHLGKDGKAAAALAIATAPTGASSTSAQQSGAPVVTSDATSIPRQGHSVIQPSGDSSLSSLTGALTGSNDGGLGWLFPLLLATSLIAAIVLGVVRSRRGGPPEVGA